MNIVIAKEIINRYCWTYIDFKRVKKKFDENYKKFFDTDYNETRAIMITCTYEPFMIIYINKNFSDMFGYSYEDVIKHTPKTIFNGKYTDNQIAKSKKERCERMVLTKKPVVDIIINHKSNGTPVICPMIIDYWSMTKDDRHEIYITYFLERQLSDKMDIFNLFSKNKYCKNELIQEKIRI